MIIINKHTSATKRITIKSLESTELSTIICVNNASMSGAHERGYTVLGGEIYPD